MNIFEVIIVQPIFNMLIGLYSVIPGGDFGISLILFTIIIRFLLYPLVKKQLHQTKAMQKIQPELAKLRQRNKGNRQAESAEMMELYKRYGVNPFLSMGILLIQLPIFIALFQVIRIFTSQRERIADFAYGFMETLEPVKQLIAHPEQFNEKLFGFIDLTKTAFSADGVSWALIILALISVATQYFMSRQTMPKVAKKRRLRDVMAEAATGKEVDQSEINTIVSRNMMNVLPVFMFFVMISVPGALALYYTVSNLVAVGQQTYLLKEDEEEMEEIVEESPSKTTSAQKRARKAQTAHITRIKASDSNKKGRS